MGNYTQFKAKIKLRKDTPKPIIELINRVVCENIEETYLEYLDWKSNCLTKFNHPFFECQRWDDLFTDTDGEDIQGGKFYQIGGYWTIDLHTQFKDYDDEIDKFIDWIKPYIVGRKRKNYIGWSKYEYHNRQYYRVNCSVEDRPIF